jgi:hypothetical protein
MNWLDVSSDSNWIQLGFSGGCCHGCCLALKLSFGDHWFYHCWFVVVIVMAVKHVQSIGIRLV